MPYIHNLNPVLLDLGPVEIRYYGLVYVIAFVLFFFWLKYLIKKKELKLTTDEMYDLVFYMMLGVLIGSRVIHAIFWDPMYFLTQPWKILYIWEGGMAFHGGLIGVAVAGYLFCRKETIRKKLTFAKLADITVIPAVFTLAIGRVVNFINGELIGTASNARWCVVFPQYDNTCRHPQVLYSAIKRFIMFGAAMFLHTKKQLKDGFIFWTMMLVFGVGRFFIDFYRDDARWFSLTAGQYLSIALTIVTIIVLIKYYGKEWKKVFC